MTPLVRPARLLVPVMGLAFAAGLLVGCGSEEAAAPDAAPTTGAASASDTAEPTASPGDGEPYLPVPAGVELTEPGSELAVGDDAVLAWQPRQDEVGVLAVEVVGVERTTFAKSFRGWDVDDRAGSTPYFVRASVTNLGETDLGGRPVPLYAEEEDGTLVEATRLGGRFRPCPRGALPGSFEPDDEADVCLVYLVQGALAGVSFRPSQDFDPITWEATRGDFGRVRRGTGMPQESETTRPSRPTGPTETPTSR